MSTTPELGMLPPSPEVQREMALTKIRFFQTANADYRQLAALIHRHPSTKRLAGINDVSKAMEYSSGPLIDTNFFRDIDPSLVEITVGALIDEVVENRELICELQDDTDEDRDDGREYDDEFRHGLIKRVLEEETETASEESARPIFVMNPLEELSPPDLIKFMGKIHQCTIADIFESLEQSDRVQAGLEQEYLRREKVRTAVIGVVAFTGALGGTLIGQKLDKRK